MSPNQNHFITENSLSSDNLNYINHSGFEMKWFEDKNDIFCSTCTDKPVIDGCLDINMEINIVLFCIKRKMFCNIV